MGRREDEINPFWEFSLAFYCRGPVASICLNLQDKVGADVNILLYCCWLGYKGAGQIEVSEFAEIISGIKAWQFHVVKPLRKIRRDIKNLETLHLGDFSKNFLQSIKDCELESEELEQLVLYRSGPQKFPHYSDRIEVKIENIKKNLENYLNLISIPSNDEINGSINTLCEEMKVAVDDDFR